jgi:uncharacterized protein (DUF885 family)
VRGDELADELLQAVLSADPLEGSLFGFPGYDDLLPDFGREAEREHALALDSIATRAEEVPEDGLTETELQTLDFVRCLARGMAGAARVPIIEFTISDTFAAPVGNVLATLPKVMVDTDERRAGYLARLRGLPGMLSTVAERHVDGAREGRTAVRRLVEASIAQLDLVIADPTMGAVARTDDDGAFVDAVSAAIDDHARPALVAYREALSTTVLPYSRDDDHPGLCHLPDGEEMYRRLARLHTSMDSSPEELHAIGCEIVEEVRE